MILNSLSKSVKINLKESRVRERICNYAIAITINLNLNLIRKNGMR